MVADLLLDVPTSPGNGTRARSSARLALDWRGTYGRRNVVHGRLDALRMDARALGVSRRCACRAKTGIHELLDEQLLGWRRCGDWRRACARRARANLEAVTLARRGTPRHWHRDTRQQPAV